MSSTKARGSSFLRSPIFVVLLVYLLCPSAFCQTRDSIPIPEYFGIYAVLDGKLIKLDSDQVRLDNRITVRLGVRHAVGNILQGQPVASSQNDDIPSLAPDLKIVVFSEPSGMQSPLAVAKSLHLESLVFVRNLLVDTGWPQNLRRSGLENGWESGDAPELGGIATGDRANALEFLVKPMAGRADMVIAALSEPLKPGVYRLSAGPSAPLFRRGGFLFGVEPIQQGEAMKCVDATVTYAMNMSKSKYTPCGPGVGQPIASAMPTASARACADYDACLQAGIKAFFSSDWQGAIMDFEAATSQRPTEANPWGWLGRAYLALGRQQEATAMWDKTLNLGGRMVFQVCLERAFKPCERGDLSLAPAEVSFILLNRQNVFAAAPADVSAMKMGIFKNSARGFINLQVKKEKYQFEYSPYGGNCRIQSIVECPQNELAQQLTVAKYVSQTLPKLAAGAFAPPARPASPADAPAGSTATGNSIPSANQQLIEQMKSMIAGYEKADDFRSPLDSQQFLDMILKESQQAGVPPWLLFGQVRFETTFGDPINATVRDGMPFTDGTSGNAHNLFNIRPGSNWTGKILDTGQGGKFRVYPSFDDSVRNYLQLISGSTYRGQTLKQLVNTYFPASENGAARVQSYIDSIIQLAGKLGVPVNENTVPVQ